MVAKEVMAAGGDQLPRIVAPAQRGVDLRTEVVDGAEPPDALPVGEVVRDADREPLGQVNGVAGRVFPEPEGIVPGAGQRQHDPAGLQLPVVFVAAVAPLGKGVALRGHDRRAEKAVRIEGGQLLDELPAAVVLGAAQEADRMAFRLPVVSGDPVEDLLGEGHRQRDAAVSAVGLPAEEHRRPAGHREGAILAVDQRQRGRRCAEGYDPPLQGAHVAHHAVEKPAADLARHVLAIDLAAVGREPPGAELIGGTDPQAQDPVVDAVFARIVDHCRADQLPEAVQQQVGNIVRIRMGQEQELHRARPIATETSRAGLIRPLPAAGAFGGTTCPGTGGGWPPARRCGRRPFRSS